MAEQDPQGKTPAARLLVDILVFRVLGLGIIIHEVVLTPTSEWDLLVAGFGCFFMPDALAGRHALALDLIRRLLEREK